jgi:hypothetical protein
MSENWGNQPSCLIKDKLKTKDKIVRLYSLARNLDDACKV